MCPVTTIRTAEKSSGKAPWGLVHETPGVLLAELGWFQEPEGVREPEGRRSAGPWAFLGGAARERKLSRNTPIGLLVER